MCEVRALVLGGVVLVVWLCIVCVPLLVATVVKLMIPANGFYICIYIYKRKVTGVLAAEPATILVV